MPTSSLRESSSEKSGFCCARQIAAGMIGLGCILAIMLPSALAGIDVSRWKEERIQLAPLHLSFRVPAGHDPAYPKFPTIERLDLFRDLTPAKPVAVVFKHAWSYPGFFWQGVRGGFTLTISVERRRDDREIDVRSFDNLEQLMRQELYDTYESSNAELRRQGQLDRTVVLFDEFKRIELKSRVWLVYRLGGAWKDSTIYVTPLTRNTYLRAEVRFVDNSNRTDMKWRKNAQTVSDQIFESLEIRETD